MKSDRDMTNVIPDSSSLVTNTAPTHARRGISCLWLSAVDLQTASTVARQS